MTGAALAAAARALVGTPFRLNGRDPATGLDCLGVVISSLVAIGRTDNGLRQHAYSMRRRGLGDADELAALLGLVAAAGEPQAGDILLVQCSPVQPHVLISLHAGEFVHAHAGLRRVVSGPQDLTWPVARHWRLPRLG